MESSSKHELMSAAKEIKRNLEDLAVQSTRSSLGGIGGYGEFSGKFTQVWSGEIWNTSAHDEERNTNVAEVNN